MSGQWIVSSDLNTIQAKLRCSVFATCERDVWAQDLGAADSGTASGNLQHPTSDGKVMMDRPPRLADSTPSPEERGGRVREAVATITIRTPNFRRPRDPQKPDISVPTDPPPLPTYPAWSEREHRWVAMTFVEHRAWLTRPDLDPAEFASGQVAS